MAISQPALIGATQKRKQNQQHPQFLFPQPEMNFSEGRALPPSNNAQAQSLFQRNDPFARNVPGAGATVAPGVSSVVDASRFGQAAGVPAETVEPIAGQQAPAALDQPVSLSGDRLALVKPVRPLDILDNPVGAAAQLLGAALINNPFISAKGRQALREGRLPQPNDIQPAFFRFTPPQHVQELQGLLAAAGPSISLPLQDQAFFQNVFRAPGL